MYRFSVQPWGLQRITNQIRYIFAPHIFVGRRTGTRAQRYQMHGKISDRASGSSQVLVAAKRQIAVLVPSAEQKLHGSTVLRAVKQTEVLKVQVR